MSIRRIRPHHDRGATLVELMIALVLLGLIIAVAHGSVTAQMQAYSTQSMVAETQFAARSALKVLADQVAMAGFGVPIPTTPSDATSIVTAESSRLSFWTNIRSEHTFLSATAIRGATSVTVLSGTGLTAGTSVYISDASDWYLGTVQKAGETTIVLSPALTYNFAAGSLVTPVEQVTFELKGTTLMRNGRAFIPNVSTLQFTYDAEKLAAIRSIGIRLGLNTRAVAADTKRILSVTVATQVAPANLAL